MKRLLKIFMMGALLAVTWSIHVLHLGVVVSPEISAQDLGPGTSQWSGKWSGTWIDKTKFGMHQLILSGSPYQRGLESGRLTQDLLYRQEKELIEKLKQFIPNSWVRAGLELLAIRWFWGIEDYIEPWALQEMAGVSKSASHEFDGIVDGLTRQVAYHGLHEVSQMAVDQGGDDMGCTVVAIPFRGSWVVGRNFDFEGGRIFDSEKILKWVFPSSDSSSGYAYVSVIWAGMVGAVTAVNEHGVYISLNAAGSTDFRRYGTPSTLVLVKAIQNSKTVEDAVRIIRDETLFITDIFVAVDGKTGRAYHIEKSPRRTEVLPLEGPSIVTNHLVGKSWENDPINRFRKDELTSQYRADRGQSLLRAFVNAPASDSHGVESFVLSMLRDKGEVDGKRLSLGNRRAIDALIAAHSVIYNAANQILYVSQGPGVSGPFTGFDLKASFQTRVPVSVRSLPRDPLVTDETFMNVRHSAQEISKAQHFLNHGRCDQGWQSLLKARQLFSESSGYYATLGDYYQCKGNLQEARIAWKKALAFHPAYAEQIRKLERKLKP